MTTAHRATWKAARGGLQEEGSFRLHVPSEAVSAKDVAGETSLKLRAPQRQTRDALRALLEDGEQSARVKKRARFAIEDESSALKLGMGDSVPPELRVGDASHGADADVRLGAGSADEAESGSASESDSDDDDDDEAELLAELEKIRKERAFEKAKKQSEEQERMENEQVDKRDANAVWNNLGFNDDISDTASLATGSVPAFAVRRRWDDDVLFRDQARRERKPTQRFINDTIRNDFHRRFMKRYMR